MAELAEQSALVVLEAGGGAIGDDREGMADSRKRVSTPAVSDPS